MFSQLVQRYRRKLDRNGPSQLLRELSRNLRSDDVPGVLREAARSVASLLDGSQGKDDGASPGVTINVTVAVAVGAPGKDQEDGGASQPSAKEGVVIASAVASSAKPSPAPSKEPKG